MRTIQYLTDAVYRDLYLPGVLAGVALAVMASPLSVLVVLKRLAFIGQGISHAAFGGIGVAAVLGLTATMTTAAPAGGLWQFLVVLSFCLGASVLVGVLARGQSGREDTAIGVVLVVSMAVGAVLLQKAATGLAWESFLFGSILNVSWTDAGAAWVVACVVLAALAWVRRPMVFACFDEPAASASGVAVGRMSLVLLLLLGVAIVSSMKLAGVVLATANLVFPGAIALSLSERGARVVGLALGAGLVSVLGGLVLSFEADIQPGPAIVMVQAGLLGLARAARWMRR